MPDRRRFLQARQDDFSTTSSPPTSLLAPPSSNMPQTSQKSTENDVSPTSMVGNQTSSYTSIFPTLIPIIQNPTSNVIQPSLAFTASQQTIAPHDIFSVVLQQSTSNVIQPGSSVIVQQSTSGILMPTTSLSPAPPSIYVQHSTVGIIVPITSSNPPPLSINVQHSTIGIIMPTPAVPTVQSNLSPSGAPSTSKQDEL